MGRPRKPEAEKRKNETRFNATPDERAQIERAWRYANAPSLSEYLRRIVLPQVERDIADHEAAEAAAASSTQRRSAVPDDMLNAVQAMREILDQLIKKWGRAEKS